VTVSGLVVNNNILAESGVGIEANIGGLGDGNVYSNNLVWQNGMNMDLGPGQSPANTVSGQSPNFVNDVESSQRDFHLQAGKSSNRCRHLAGCAIDRLRRLLF
jgi:hypothetical protein